MRYKLLNTNILDAKAGDIVELSDEQVRTARAYNVALQPVADETHSQTSQEPVTDVSDSKEGNTTTQAQETPQTANTEATEPATGE